MPVSELSRDSGLKGRIAVVTGAASGMGRATARLFADVGVRVAVADVNEPAAEAVAAELRSAGADAAAFGVDLSDAAATRRFAADVLHRFGAVDILVNNAGVGGPSMITSGTDAEFEQAWALSWAVNAAAQARLVRAFVHSLKRDGEGRVVNIASTEGSGASIGGAAYVAAKHASVGLTKALAVELASQGVCVNCVQPGPIRTGMTIGIPERSKDYYAKRLVPMRRYGLPEEVAQVTVSLCMPAMRYVNGAVIPADGGLLANNALLPMRLPWREATALPDDRAGRKGAMLTPEATSKL